MRLGVSCIASFDPLRIFVFLKSKFTSDTFAEQSSKLWQGASIRRMISVLYSGNKTLKGINLLFVTI